MTTLMFADDVLAWTNMSEQELATELAIALYQREKVTLEQAARLAKLDRIDFQHLLASRDLYLTLDIDDLEQDISLLRSHGRL
jgi:predicted HTH domain antitoxin